MSTIMGWLGSSIDMERFKTGFSDKHAGSTEIVNTGTSILGFHGITEAGAQLFRLGRYIAICDGSIHNSEELRAELEWKYPFRTNSSCELLPLFQEYGPTIFETLRAELACIIYDGNERKLIAARDPFGVCPLYYGFDEKGGIAFASKKECLKHICKSIHSFPPGHYYKDGVLVCYAEPQNVQVSHKPDRLRRCV